MVRESPFLPGGVWFCVACYGAGTPPSSAFYPWLAQLAEQGGSREHAAAVLRALPRAGERPFVAALPQALLANPAGPLAMIGHMDLAWTFGFTDPDGRQSRASRMHAAQRALFGGSRAGVGLDAIMHAYREVNDDLMARYQLQRFGRGGFIRLCLRTRTPLVPCAIVGAEEANPLLYRFEHLTRALGIPYVPITPTFPALGPLGLVPAPTKTTRPPLRRALASMSASTLRSSSRATVYCRKAFSASASIEACIASLRAPASWISRWARAISPWFRL